MTRDEARTGVDIDSADKVELSMRKYQRSDKFKLVVKKHQQTQTFRNTQKRYANSEKGKMNRERYTQSTKGITGRATRKANKMLMQEAEAWLELYPDKTITEFLNLKQEEK